MKFNIPHNLTVKEYIRYFLSKHDSLSAFELATLATDYEESDNRGLLEKKHTCFYNQIPVVLSLLKKEGKVEKAGNKKWKWIDD